MRAGYCLLPFLAAAWGCQSNDLSEAAGTYDTVEARAKAAGIPLVAMDIIPNPVPDEQNSAVILRQANLEPVVAALSNDERPDAVSALVRAHAAEFALVERAAAAKAFQPPVNWDSMSSDTGRDSVKLKDCVRLLRARSLWQANRGNVTAAIQDIQRMASLSRQSYQHPTLISHLVAIALESIRLRTVEEVAEAFASNPAALGRIEQVVPLEPGPDLWATMRGEAYYFLSTMRNLDAYGGLKTFENLYGEGENFPTPDPSKLQTSGPPKGVANRAMAARGLGFYTDLLNGLKEHAGDYRAQTEMMQAQDVKLEAARGASYDAIKTLASVFSQAGEATANVVSKQGATQWYVRLHKMRAEGGLPNELPKEAVDPVFKMPYGYARTERGFKLWSAGRDGKDNGGVRRSEAESKPGSPAPPYDEVIEYPRPKS